MSPWDPRDTGDEATILSNRSSSIIMPLEEEHRCIVAWRERHDERARTALVEANLRFIFSMARRFEGFNVPTADMVAAGAVGLTVAIDRFDLSRPVRFTTYAAYWIRTEMMALILTSTGIGHSLGSKPGKLFFKLRREKRLIDEADDRDVVLANVAAKYRVSSSMLEILLTEITSIPGSLDVPVGPEMITTRRDAIPDAKPLSDVLLAEQRHTVALTKALAAAMNQLTPRERYVIEHRHLVDDDQRENLVDIGKKFGVSREAVRLWEMKAFKKMAPILQKYLSGGQMEHPARLERA